MKKAFSYQWRKKYRQWLFWIGFLVGPVVWYFSSFSDALLFITAVIVFWYTRETFDLKQISNKQLKESRKQADMQLRPYLRLQWNDGDAKNVYDIVNEGEGLALNVVFKSMRFQDQDIPSVYQIKSRPLIAKSKPTTVTVDELNNTDNIVQGIGIKGYLESWIPKGHFIQVTYDDVESRKYKAVFQSDPSYNDKFKIVEQGRTK